MPKRHFTPFVDVAAANTMLGFFIETCPEIAPAILQLRSDVLAHPISSQLHEAESHADFVVGEVMRVQERHVLKDGTTVFSNIGVLSQLKFLDKEIGAFAKSLEAVCTAGVSDVHADSHLKNTLGTLYAHGVGVEQNYEKARAIFLSLAEKGYAPAQHNMGVLCYRAGEGSREEALRYYALAAEQGYKHSEEDEKKVMAGYALKALAGLKGTKPDSADFDAMVDFAEKHGAGAAPSSAIASPHLSGSTSHGAGRSS